MACYLQPLLSQYYCRGIKVHQRRSLNVIFEIQNQKKLKLQIRTIRAFADCRFLLHLSETISFYLKIRQIYLVGFFNFIDSDLMIDLVRLKSFKNYNKYLNVYFN